LCLQRHALRLGRAARGSSAMNSTASQFWNHTGIRQAGLRSGNNTAPKLPTGTPRQPYLPLTYTNRMDLDSVGGVRRRLCAQSGASNGAQKTTRRTHLHHPTTTAAPPPQRSSCAAAHTPLNPTPGPSAPAPARCQLPFAACRMHLSAPPPLPAVGHTATGSGRPLLDAAPISHVQNPMVAGQGLSTCDSWPDDVLSKCAACNAVCV